MLMRGVSGADQHPLPTLWQSEGEQTHFYSPTVEAQNYSVGRYHWSGRVHRIGTRAGQTLHPITFIGSRDIHRKCLGTRRKHVGAGISRRMVGFCRYYRLGGTDNFRSPAHSSFHCRWLFSCGFHRRPPAAFFTSPLEEAFATALARVMEEMVMKKRADELGAATL